MSEETEDTTQQQNTQPADNGNGAGKMFTQEEVNRLDSDRLARDRESRANQQQNEEKETALKARESRLDCREYITENKYSVDLLDLLDTSDVDKFKATVEKLADIFDHGRPHFIKPPQFTDAKGNVKPGYPDPIRDAFKPQT